jgi:hypothetical protein
MATGDSDNLVERVRQILPRRWFHWDAPIRDALLGGIADGAAWNYALLAFVRLQSRIASSTGIFLDLIGWDFFGGRFVRRNGESDSSFRPRIILEILRPRQTRAAIIRMLTDLTGRAPVVREFFNPGDAGGYNIPQMGGYGTGPGFYGSLQFPNTVFITAYRSPEQGIPAVDGYGGYAGGYGIGTIEYVNLNFVAGNLTDAEIYQDVRDTVAAGVIPWVALED